MGTWMKKLIEAEGVTEYLPGPHLAELEKRFGGTGAVILMLDVSFSMSGARLHAAKQGCAGFIDDAVAGGYEVGLLLWNQGVAGFAPPQPGGDEARRLLASADVAGSTDAVPGLSAAGAHLLGMEATDRVIAVFGDGDLGDETKAVRKARELHKAGIRIVTLGLGDSSARALSVIASDPVEAPRAASVGSLKEDIRGMAQGLTLRKRRGAGRS